MKFFIYIRPFFIGTNFCFLRLYFSAFLFNYFKNVNNTSVSFDHSFLVIFFYFYSYIHITFFSYGKIFFPFFLTNLFSYNFLNPFFFRSFFNRYDFFCFDFFDFYKNFTEVTVPNNNFFFVFIPFFIVEIYHFSKYINLEEPVYSLTSKSYDFSSYLYLLLIVLWLNLCLALLALLLLNRTLLCLGHGKLILQKVSTFSTHF